MNHPEIGPQCSEALEVDREVIENFAYSTLYAFLKLSQDKANPTLSQEERQVFAQQLATLYGVPIESLL